VTEPLQDILVLGLGSAFGDDRIGWAAVDRLARAGVAAAIPVRDGVELLLALEGADEVIVIDASRPAGCPGRVGCFEWPSRELLDEALWSTHGLGLTAALQMAEALGRLPRRVTIYTVEADASPPGHALSEAAERGLERLIDGIMTSFISQKKH